MVVGILFVINSGSPVPLLIFGTIAIGAFLIGMLFPRPHIGTSTSSSSGYQDSTIRVEHTKQHNILEKMAWLATIAAAIVAALAFFAS